MRRANGRSAGALVPSMQGKGERRATKAKVGTRGSPGDIGRDDQQAQDHEQVPGPGVSKAGLLLPDRLPATIPILTTKLEGLKLTSPNRTRFATRGGALAQAAKAKRMRELGALATRGCVSSLFLRGPTMYGANVRVTIVRIAPRAFDDDNFVASCKALRDGIADAFGLKDHDERISFWYEQTRGKPREYGVVLQFLITPRVAT